MTEFLSKQGNIQVINSLIDELKELGNKPDQENSVKNLINCIIELYKNNWETPQSSTPLYNPYAKGNNLNNQMNQMNQMNQIDYDLANYDEQVYDEFGGYDFGPCGDENNEDVCDAFEEFLKASGQL